MNNLNPELLEKAKNAKSVQELMDMAKENNVEITQQEAEDIFTKLTTPPSGELSDDDLDNIAGGGCGGGSKKPKSRFEVGDLVVYSKAPDYENPAKITEKVYENGSWKYAVSYRGQNLAYLSEFMLEKVN